MTPRSILTHTSSLTVASEGTPCDLAAVRHRLTSSAGTRNVLSGNPGNVGYNNYAFSVLGMAVELAEQRTTMISSPMRGFARDVADRVVFMDGGVVVEQGKPEEVFDHPRMSGPGSSCGP